MELDIETKLNNTRSLLQELGNSVSTLVNSSPDVFEDQSIKSCLRDFLNVYQEAVQRLENPSFRIATIGTTSSGKSTIVNALIGRKIAPIEAGEMSGGVLTLKHSEKQRLIIEQTEDAAWDTGEWTGLNDEDLYQRIRAVMHCYHDARKKREYVAPQIAAYVPLLPGCDCSFLGLPKGIGIELIDLPGLKSVQDRTNLATIQEQVNKAFSLTENAGQIIRHLAETPGLTHKITTLPFSPILGGIDIIGHGMTYHKLIGIEQTLSSVMGLTQIAAGASVLNLGVSIAGFAYMGYKLHQIQKSLGDLQQSMEEGFNRVEAGLNRVENRLDTISGQLAYLYLLVEDSRQKQQSLAKAISHLHQAMLIQEIAALTAELDDRKRFPNESARESLKVASRVRLFLSNQAMQSTPELDAEIMLNSDVSIQGWAVATATEVNLLLEIGQHQEAKELLAVEVPKFQQVAQQWGTELISEENSYLSTAYRFTHSRFNKYITSERVERITEIYSSDRALSPEQIRRKKTNVDVELEMSYSSSKFDEVWTHRQIAVAEYLDTLSELSARLDSLQNFAALCESLNVKSSKEILPDANTESGLYILPEN